MRVPFVTRNHIGPSPDGFPFMDWGKGVVDIRVVGIVDCHLWWDKELKGWVISGRPKEEPCECS